MGWVLNIPTRSLLNEDWVGVGVRRWKVGWLTPVLLGGGEGWFKGQLTPTYWPPTLVGD